MSLTGSIELINVQYTGLQAACWKQTSHRERTYPGIQLLKANSILALPHPQRTAISFTSLSSKDGTKSRTCLHIWRQHLQLLLWVLLSFTTTTYRSLPHQSSTLSVLALFLDLRNYLYLLCFSQLQFGFSFIGG